MIILPLIMSAKQDKQMTTHSKNNKSIIKLDLSSSLKYLGKLLERGIRVSLYAVGLFLTILTKCALILVRHIKAGFSLLNKRTKR